MTRPDNYMYQESDCSAHCMFFKFGPTTMATYFQLYNIFGVTWLLFMVSAFNEMVMAGAFASWYFTRCAHRLNFCQVCSLQKRSLICQINDRSSVALFGSFQQFNSCGFHIIALT